MNDLSVTGNERIVPGGNNPPAFDAHKAHIDDLFEEAQNWLVGKAIESAAEAEGVEALLDMARQAKKAADEARAAEKAPFLEKGRAVDALWAPIIKRADMIADTCKQVLTPWRTEIARQKEAAALKARLEAEAEREAAQAAMRASSGDVEARERAEEQLATAKEAERYAAKQERQATTGLGLRTSYRPEIDDLSAAIRFYWKGHRERFLELVLELAREDIRAGRRTIPGIRVVDDAKAV